MVDVRHLVWDPRNVTHIARHGVTPQEVQDVCFGDHVSVASYLGREVVTGLASSGRFITAVVEAVGETGNYYTVSARPASRKERRYYHDQQEGGSP